MKEGERQVAPDVSGIRRDHVARYETAARLLHGKKSVVDFACGVGYGTQLLSKRGFKVIGIDRDAEAIAYAKKHYRGPEFRVGEEVSGCFDAAVCFEIIEHIEDPLPLLKSLHKATDTLIASVPNEAVFPWQSYAFHFRHYTKEDFRELLEAAGWQVTEWYGQTGPESEVEKNCNGRTIIAVAKRVKTVEKPKGLHVAILGLGPSLRDYVEITRRLGARAKFADEVWGINALGDIIQCDRVFHMDDVRIQEIRAKAAPDSNIAAMLGWLKRHPGPVYTSNPHPDYPGLVEFPLEEVINSTGMAYMNNTAAYAVAYAIHKGVKKLSLFGIDFTYPNAHHAEKGRACVEFLLGIAHARGIKLQMPRASSLMDACVPFSQRLYGYDLKKATVKDDGGKFKVEFTNATEIPTAEVIERAYDHERHPNPLVEA